MVLAVFSLMYSSSLEILMMKYIKILNEKFKDFYLDKFSKIIEINEKYAQPKIGMSPTVKISLFLLRLYLIFLLFLFVFKFITVIK